MAQGTSGRVVIDIDPHLKKDVYQALKSKGCNMREWFLHMVEREFALSEAEAKRQQAHEKDPLSF